MRHATRVELLFALAFALWCVVRAHMPRIETAGGEKWMEIAFLNAVLRAPRFPPHDPWLSGFAISYYYFGYVMMGMLTHLAAVPSTMAFNLGIATLFALTVTGAYGLVYALLAGEGERVARWGGLLGALMVAAGRQPGGGPGGPLRPGTFPGRVLEMAGHPLHQRRAAAPRRGLLDAQPLYVVVAGLAGPARLRSLAHPG
jgi:hypothetical protein